MATPTFIKTLNEQFNGLRKIKILPKSGVEISKIGELMRHTSLKTTQIYLDAFDDEDLFEATQNLL